MTKSIDTTKTALCLDDDQGVLNTLVSVFHNLGWKCLTTSDENEALRLFSKQHIDLFTTDVMHPGTGGIQFIEDLLDDDHLNNTSVLIVSGQRKNNIEKEMKKRLQAKHNLFRAILTKPFSEDDLADMIRKLITQTPPL